MKGRGVESNPKSWNTGKETAALLDIAVGSAVSNDDRQTDYMDLKYATEGGQDRSVDGAPSNWQGAR